MPQGGTQPGQGDAIPGPQLALLALGHPGDSGCPRRVPTVPRLGCQHTQCQPLYTHLSCPLWSQSLQGWDPQGYSEGDPLCSGIGSTEAWMEALRGRCPAPNAGTHCTWHLLGNHTAASPCSGLDPAVQMPSTTLLPRADPDLLLGASRVPPAAASPGLSPLALR